MCACIVCMCVHVCMSAWGGSEGGLLRVCFLLPLCESQGFCSGCQSWGQGPLPPETSYLYSLLKIAYITLKMNFRGGEMALFEVENYFKVTVISMVWYYCQDK